MFINEKQKHLIESNAKTNGIERVAVWLYNADKNSITSEVIFSLSENVFLPGLTVYKKDFPNYFKALDEDRVIDAHDAITDPRTSEFSEIYLKPLNISSLLDVPIKIGPHTVGVICHEHVGEKRTWTQKEIQYATSIADLFSLTIETQEKDKIFNTLLESDRNFNLALTSLPVIYWTTDLNLKIISTRGKGLQNIGLIPENDVGRTIYEFYADTIGISETVHAHEKVLKGESVRFESQIKDQFFENYVEPLRDANNLIIGCFGMALNITERKKTENNLKANEEHTRSIVQASIDAVITIDDKGIITSWNGKAEKILGWTEQEAIGIQLADLIIPVKYREAHSRGFKRFFETGEGPILGKIIETKALHKNGHEFPVDLSIATIKLGDKMAFCGFLRDITERKKAEEEIHTSEARFRRFAEINNEGVVFHNEGIITESNSAFAKMFGYEEKEVVGMREFQFMAGPESIEIIKKNIKEKVTVPFEVLAKRKDGTVFYAEMHGRKINYKGEELTVTTVLDITRRKEIENELHENEKRFRLLAETTIIIPWETDATTFQFTYVGPQAEMILGYPVNDWYTKDFWAKKMHPDDKEQALAFCFQAYKTLENYEFEYRMIAKNGDIVWFRDLVTVESKNNKPIILRGYLIDITSRKVAEEKIQKLNIELEQRVDERTSELIAINKELIKAKITAEESRVAKELFLASMSHEIRTPLNAIIGFQQLLKETPLNDEQQEFVESIDFAGRNLLVIINDILDLSKIESGKFEFDETEFNVSDVVHSVIELVEHRAKEKYLQLFFSHDSAIPKELYGDATRLSQVLLNLLGNAVKFTEKGEVKIVTRLLAETNDNIECEFIVSDTGIGITKDKLPMIFDSFAQENIETTRKYGGTGLGLTISKRLVEMQGGTISVNSEKGKGSSFTVRLKIKKSPSNVVIGNLTNSGDSQLSLKNKTLSILLAEDVLLNQRLVVKIMERWGHNLDIADNGKIAVDMVQAKDYDLVLMDIQMPIMDGYHAAEMIRSLSDLKKQKVPIVALTAHASHAEAEKCINLGMNAYLAKPFNQQSLQAIINQLTADK